MSNVAMILKRSPYGDINAAEAVRHALGAVSFEMTVDLILVDAGCCSQRRDRTTAVRGSRILRARLKTVWTWRVGLCRRCFAQGAARRVE